MKSLLIVLLSTFLLISCNDFSKEEDYMVAKTCGIDVSHYNELRLWDSLPEEVEFAYVKVSQGASFKDPMRHAHIKQAKKHQLSVGVYHFFEQDIPADIQFANLMKSLDGFQPDLPVAVDFEFIQVLHKNA